MSEYGPNLTATQTLTPALVIPSVEPLMGQGTLKSGNNLTRGAVLGKVTASGKYKAYDADATDGSQSIAGILVDDTDATSADKVCSIYTFGNFNIEALVTEETIVAGIYNNGTIVITKEDN